MEMSFTTINFILFLFMVVLVHYLLPVRIRKYWLILSSGYFCANADVKLIFILFLIALITYFGGYCIFHSKERKKNYFIFFFTVNIFILFFFKYIPFFIRTVNILSELIHLPLQFEVPAVFVPVGLSFIIFQASTYLGDIYRGKIDPVSFPDFFLFISWFPTVLSGPIQKAGDFLGQLKKSKPFYFERFRSGFFLVVYGLLEKFLVADVLAKIVNTVFDDYQHYYGLYYLIAAVCYSFQIYADFSSYSDIARGISRMLGIEVVKNFQNPYLSQSIAEFWRNWHMSLNAWLVEYIYIPLGGSRCKKWRKYLNTMIVFSCSGLWHGASWHYVIWGIINGMLQVIGEMTGGLRNRLCRMMRIEQDSVFRKWMGRGIAFGLISTTWIFFRVPSVTGALGIIREIYGMGIIGLFNAEAWEIFGNYQYFAFSVVALIAFGKIQCMRRKGASLYIQYLKESTFVQILFLAIVVVVLIVCFGRTVTHPNTEYIYFQF